MNPAPTKASPKKANPLVQANEARGLLKSIFGYDSFRGEQESIVNHAISGGDTLVLMPTGGGKSLCFQIPALARGGTTVVISPLISLMQDQVETLDQLGIDAAFLNSSLSAKQQREVEQKLLAGELDLLYLAPERLMTSNTLDMLEEVDVSLFAVDEAHCVSKWGHDFRPEYMKLKILASRFPNVPRMALTATADKRTRSEIIKELKLEKAKVFLNSFDRPNISYSISKREGQGHDQLLEFLKEQKLGESGIVYCLSRRKVDEVTELLVRKGFNAYAYHAGMDAKTRKSNQERFLLEDGVIMVATIAFGMGIDKPDVRFVLHLDMPKNIESYYQETGRAGRDGMRATAHLFYSNRDIVVLKMMVRKSRLPANRNRLENEGLENMLGLCETLNCRRQTILASFDEVYPKRCGNCDTCWDKFENPRRGVAANLWVKNILTLVYKTGQKLDQYDMAELIIGTVTVAVRENGYFDLEGFGFAQKWTEKGAYYALRQLQTWGLLRVDSESGGCIRLTNKSLEFLKTPFEVKFRQDPLIYGKGGTSSRSKKKPATKRRRKSTKKKKYEKSNIPSIPFEAKNEDDRLYMTLKTYRGGIAKKMRIPAYKIFHDATLMEMSKARPQSLDDMLEVSGVGEKKLKKFGKSFLNIITEF